ncbi:hypothetical protein SETIT_8G166000v2 [Setaria italica]|uniref:Epidermal patterning factor-like protein n=1 Tax=Setaria italica TaxID=4555 RepID=K3ZK77_SETIT|nr:EPIDERMAL PATTERNING FACTOR-like protein 4 [Setaria italica]RCV38731.1 hypothetical protein SETIT_8G166000v2 [Setaria italica]
MGDEGCRRLRVGRRRRCSDAALLAAVLLAAAMVVTAAGRPIRLPAAALARRRIDSSTAVTAATTRISGTWTADAAAFPAARRRWLVGPGSSPPTCRGRCGRCAPCRPTRVAIQPGVGPQWEYYPEVWRCKCGNKLFMP